MKIEGCVALVTGANRGLGEAFARALLADERTRMVKGALSLEQSPYLAAPV
jgi:NAD(P)-dependent dehydrogenase (short-subunit alcohol dehydrogenase family)